MKTALVLSGGGSKGAYEIGVYQALLDMDVKVDIVVGTSIGAMNAYIIAQNKFEVAKKLWLELTTPDVFDMPEAPAPKSLQEKLMPNNARFAAIKKVLRENFSEEAVRSSKIEFGLCTVQIPTSAERGAISEAFKDPAIPLDFGDIKRLKPEVLKLWEEDIPRGRMLDYVLASCSIIPITVPYEIDGKSYIDGGFADQMPISMALEKNADRIIAVNLEAVGFTRFIDIAKAEMENKLIMISPSGPTGNLAEFIPENSKRIMHMGYIDTLRAFKKKKLV
ncbi:MAG: patatin-like phospholipase family protein [Firmicutes bacterium]|nr:patatin-like phospholipase family protein [Bacillota bacterium]